MYSMKSIGIIQSVFHDTKTAARQARIDGRPGKLILDEKYMEGLSGLEDFSHIIVLYCFHEQTEVRLRARPLFDKKKSYGIFASRFPSRPNHIGLSVLALQKIDGNVLYCEDVDPLSGTPILDIKPYVKHFDCVSKSKCGWYENVDWDNIYP